MKTIVEIKGERHRLVKGRKGGKTCSVCSLFKHCNKVVGAPCLDIYDYFKRENKENTD